MKKVPSIIEFLKHISNNEENFKWEAIENINNNINVVSIKTNRVLTDIEKAKIERFGTYHGGPAFYKFKAYL